MRKAIVGLALAVSSVVVVAAAIAAIATWDEGGPTTDEPHSAESTLDVDVWPSPDAKFGFDEWMARLERGNLVSRCRVIRRFSASPLTPEQTTAIVVRAANDRADGVRYYLAVESADHPAWFTDATLPSFTALVRDPDAVIAMRARAGLWNAAKSGNQAAVAMLRELSRDGPAKLRGDAFVALARSGHATADDVETIIASLDAADEWTRSAAVRAAGLLGPRASSCARRLAEMLVHDDCAVCASDSLPQVAPQYGRDHELVAGVIGGLDSRDAWARRHCCRMLRHTAMSVVVALRRLDDIAAADPDVGAQVAAIVTLAILRHDAKGAAEKLEVLRPRLGRWLAIHVDEEVRWTGETDPRALELERRFWDERER